MRPIVMLIAVLCCFLAAAPALAAPCCPGGQCAVSSLPAPGPYDYIVPQNALTVRLGGIIYKVTDLPCDCPYLTPAQWEKCYEEYRSTIDPAGAAPLMLVSYARDAAAP